jgi:hypothetical protein
VGGLQSGSPGSADGVAAAGVFVFGGDVADALVEPHGVVERLEPVELAFQLARVFDLFQVWVLGLEVPEQALDPGLVVGLTG